MTKQADYKKNAIIRKYPADLLKNEVFSVNQCVNFPFNNSQFIISEGRFTSIENNSLPAEATAPQEIGSLLNPSSFHPK